VIRTEEDPFLKPRKATAEDTLGLMMAGQGAATTKKAPLKSALKKVTTTDLLKRSATELNADNNTSNKDKQHRKISISEANNELRAVSPAILATHRQPKLRFNQQVEQCVALFADEREHGDILEEQETSDSENEGPYRKTRFVDNNDIDTPYVNHNTAVKSIKIIEPAKLKRSQSDADTDDVSSVSSASTASSGFHCSAVSPTTGDIYSSSDEHQQEEEEEEEEEEDYYSSSFYNRSAYQTVETTSATSSLSSSPITTSRRPSFGNRSSSVPIVQSYKEKTNAAEPALVTMHQNATDIHKDNGQKSSMFNNIASWAASYLWPGEAPRLPPTPKPSVSTTAIPIKTASSHSSISFSL
jgi:hypothetical protein